MNEYMVVEKNPVGSRGQIFCFSGTKERCDYFAILFSTRYNREFVVLPTNKNLIDSVDSGSIFIERKGSEYEVCAFGCLVYFEVVNNNFTPLPVYESTFTESEVNQIKKKFIEHEKKIISESKSPMIVAFKNITIGCYFVHSHKRFHKTSQDRAVDNWFNGYNFDKYTEVTPMSICDIYRLFPNFKE